MEEPLVSVIVPTRDRPTLLARALASIDAQTFCAGEIIVVDDGSQNPPHEVIAGFPSVRLIVLPRRGGAAAARNVGIRASRGEFVAFLDDDDAWLPSKLERQVELLAASPPDV